jgi:hypothetical protein
VQRTRNRQRDNSLVLAMIVMLALASLSGLTVVSVQGGIATTSTDRFHAIAVYAAESGGAATMDFLRKNINLSTKWSAFVTPSNSGTPAVLNIPGNNASWGQAGNLFSPDTQAWYSVVVLNNQNDPGFVAGTDSDGRVIIRATGYGPNGAVAQIEWDVLASGVTGLGRPCPSYAQKGMSEDGSGRNDCLGSIDTTQTATFRPGGP